MLSKKARAVAVVALVVLNMGAEAQCDQVPGEVTGRDADCFGKDAKPTDDKPLCTYQLKTSKGWFDVINRVYENCSVGEKYPQCGDKVNKGKWVPA